MENQTFYVQYLTNRPVKIDARYSADGEEERKRPLSTVYHLVAAYKTAVAPLLDQYSVAELTIQSIREGVEISYNYPLAALGENGKLGTNPLLIKSTKDARQGIVYVLTVGNEMHDWNYLSKLFPGIKDVDETLQVIETDRQFKFNSKELRLFHNDKWSLKRSGLPNLHLQDVNLETEIHQSVNNFMNGDGFLGLLIGPTGCGKTHEMLNRAKNEFTIFIDAQWQSASDYSLINQNLAQLSTIAFAFVLSRMLFLKHLKEKYPSLTPTQFLIHQLFNSRAIRHCFVSLASLSDPKLDLIRDQFIDFECLFCVDEAHVLVAHLGDLIITSMEGNHIQQNRDVNETSKIGTLSVLLHAIRDGNFAEKVIFAGTSSKLRHIENFGTFETKPAAPKILNQFTAWDCQKALEYVTSFVDLPSDVLKTVLTDNYRPRILENFVYDLFCIGENDDESPTTKEYLC